MKIRFVIFLSIFMVLSVFTPSALAYLPPDCGDCLEWDVYECVIECECESWTDCPDGGDCCDCVGTSCCWCDFYDYTWWCQYLYGQCAYCYEYEGCGCQCARVTSISGISGPYCKGASATVTANLSHSLPPGCTITWGGDASISGSGTTVKATFNTAGSNLKITAGTSCQREVPSWFTVVEVASVTSSNDSACVGYNITFTVTTNPAGYGYLISWSGGGNPATGSGSTFTTNWSTAGTKTVTATCGTSSKSKQVTVVEVDKLQYYCYVSSQWVDISGTLYVRKDGFAQFKAIPDPSSASWPSGKPIWDGSSGASGTGSTTGVTFSTLSSSSTDYKTVTAECGNTVTVNVIVYDFDGTLIPDDNFTGRSQTDYGLEETVVLGCNITPNGVTPGQIGGLRWKMPSGVGTLSNIMNNGTANYDAGAIAGDAHLWLEVISGPSWGAFKPYNRTVVAPSGINFVKKPGTGIAHDYGVSSAGFLGEIYLRPTDVSFTNLSYGEGTCPATLNGWYSLRFPSGAPHSANGPFPIGDGHITNGCKVEGEDEVFDWASSPPNYSSGYMIWSIPERYKDDTGSWEEITTSTHRADIDSAGKKTIQKAGVGPFSKNLYDPNSSY